MAFPPYTKSYQNWAPVVARVLFGAMFLFAASAKIPGNSMFAAQVAYTAAAHVPYPQLAVTLAFLLEVVAGFSLILGWHARAAAAVLMPYVVLLALLFHVHFSSPTEVGFFIDHFTLLAGLMYVSVYGARHAALRKDRG